MLLQCFSLNVYNFCSKLYWHEPDFIHIHVLGVYVYLYVGKSSFIFVHVVVCYLDKEAF